MDSDLKYLIGIVGTAAIPMGSIFLVFPWLNAVLPPFWFLVATFAYIMLASLGLLIVAIFVKDWSER